MENQATISIALAAYNGKKYIAQQLESLLKQTRLPDEIVICDDSADDLTYQALEPFLSSGIIKYIKNPQPLGVVKNFEKAINNCTGEYIFLCDQDDVWLPEKVEILANMLDKTPNLDGVFCNSFLVDENLVKLNKTLWDIRKFTNQMQKTLAAGDALKVFCRRVTCSSHNTAFKRRALEYIMPFPELEPFYPDTWIAFSIALNGSWEAINQCLTFYRVHIANQSTPLAGNVSAARKARTSSVARRNYLLAQELLKRKKSAKQANIHLLEKFALHHKNRSEYSCNVISRTAQAVREVCTLRYCHCSNGVRTFAADILFHTPPNNAG